jgi:hypothetical protein
VIEKQNLKEKTKIELLSLATKLKISGRHKMTKEALIVSIQKAFERAEAKQIRKPAKPKAKAVAKKKQVKPAKKSARKKAVSQQEQPDKGIVEKRWQEEVERAKFELFPALPQKETCYPQDLPVAYGETRITVMVRDPFWAYAYWEIEPEKLEELKRTIGKDAQQAQMILRVYDITDIEFNGTNAHHYFDIEITAMANNWYINLGAPHKTFCLDIGLKTTTGEFYLLARSNIIKTPRAWMSEILDEQWMSTQEEFEKVYALSGGYRVGAGSLELQEIVAKRLQEQITSPGISSMGSEVMPRKERERKFWLTLDTELIVYGATEPDARVYMQGRPIALRPDGTFSMRFSLPDGTQLIPVTAESADGAESRSIIPTVRRDTERPAPKIKR